MLKRKEYFWRIHHPTCRRFCRRNAWSAGWGADDLDREELERELQRGYSCCESASDLYKYFIQRGGFDGAAELRVFIGKLLAYNANGDGEPLVMPHRTVWRGPAGMVRYAAHLEALALTTEDIIRVLKKTPHEYRHGKFVIDQVRNWWENKECGETEVIAPLPDQEEEK